LNLDDVWFEEDGQRRHLRPFQRDAIEWLRHRTVGFVWIDLGLGKSIVAATACLDMIERFEPLDRVLVLGTTNLLTLTWPAEFAKWNNLRNHTYAAAVGPLKKRAAAVESMPTFLGLNYENLVWFFKHYGRSRFVPRLLVVDEITRMKAHDTKRFRELTRHTDWFYRRLGLTATPAPESYLGLWAQEACVSQRRRLGRNITQFRKDFTTATWNGVRYSYSTSEPDKLKIESAIDPITITQRKKDHLGTSEPTMINLPVPWSQRGQAAYSAMEKDFVVEVARKQDEGLSLVQAVSMAVSLNKLRQLCGGFLYQTAAEGNAREAHEIDRYKLELLADAVVSLAGEPPLIFIEYEWERAEILKLVPGAESKLTPDTKERWARHEIPALVLHPKSAGQGVDGLQKGTSTIIWYTLPWSGEYYNQANGRLAGGFRNSGRVRIYHLLRDHSIDHDVLDRLTGKLASEDALLSRVGKRQEKS